MSTSNLCKSNGPEIATQQLYLLLVLSIQLMNNREFYLCLTVQNVLIYTFVVITRALQNVKTLYGLLSVPPL